MTISEQITEYLRESRDSGHGVREMARATGLDPSVITRILSGERDITARQIDVIADWLGVRLTKPR